VQPAVVGLAPQRERAAGVRAAAPVRGSGCATCRPRGTRAPDEEHGRASWRVGRTPWARRFS
jgi:hypothetical protein